MRDNAQNRHRKDRSGKRIDMKFNRNNKPKMDLHAIYPDFWAPKWGDPPLLGFVYAESDFNAVRKAELRGMYRRNWSFGPLAVQVKDKSVRLNRKDLYTKSGSAKQVITPRA